LNSNFGGGCVFLVGAAKKEREERGRAGLICSPFLFHLRQGCFHASPCRGEAKDGARTWSWNTAHAKKIISFSNGFNYYIPWYAYTTNECTRKLTIHCFLKIIWNSKISKNVF